MTNGENILNAFPNVTTRILETKGFRYIEVEQNDKWIADFDIDWWNAECDEPKGHWIRVTDKAGHLVWECDKCGWQQRFNTNYCPDCGADMR